MQQDDGLEVPPKKRRKIAKMQDTKTIDTIINKNLNSMDSNKTVDDDQDNESKESSVLTVLQNLTVDSTQEEVSKLLELHSSPKCMSCICIFETLSSMLVLITLSFHRFLWLRRLYYIQTRIVYCKQM